MKIDISVIYFNKMGIPENGDPVVLYRNKKLVTVYSFSLIERFLGGVM